MHLVFHVIIFRVEAWWLSTSVLVIGMWLVLTVFVVGWYPFTVCVHLISSCNTFWGRWGILIF